MVYAVDRNMDYIKISNKDELDKYLAKHDVENDFEDKTIALILVCDGFLGMENEYKDLFNAMHTSNLPHLLVITDSEFQEHFDKFDNFAIAKTEFGNMFDVGAEYKPHIKTFGALSGVAL
jgi:hypothetical protein